MGVACARPSVKLSTQIDILNLFRVMMILKECSVLRLEDILPFFPDFTQIETFKVPPLSHCVCSALTLPICLLGSHMCLT